MPQAWSRRLVRAIGLEMYGDIKNLMLQGLGISPTRLHFILGSLVYALCFLGTRRPWLSLWLVITLQLGNEALDAREDIRRGIWSYGEAITDTVWTVALPFAVAGCLAAIMAVRAALPR